MIILPNLTGAQLVQRQWRQRHLRASTRPGQVSSLSRGQDSRRRANVKGKGQRKGGVVGGGSAGDKRHERFFCKKRRIAHTLLTLTNKRNAFNRRFHKKKIFITHDNLEQLCNPMRPLHKRTPPLLQKETY